MAEDLTAPLMSFLHIGLTKEEIQNKGEKWSFDGIRNRQLGKEQRKVQLTQKA